MYCVYCANAKPKPSGDQQPGDDSSDEEDVWSSMPTLDEPPKKSEYFKNF